MLIVTWTVATLIALFAAIHHGLLDRPEMHVQGNGSHARHLKWFADRTAGEPKTSNRAGSRSERITSRAYSP